MFEVVTDSIWPKITAAAKKAQRGYVAVAYFGQDGASLLPLPAGSRLVVDASERAVRSGQTCPSELLKLMRRGVEVYSAENLHAKVFVLGRAAFLSSTNASLRSKNILIEAAVRTTTPVIVGALRAFVRGLCVDPMRETQIESLSLIYRPPKFEGATAVRRGTPRSKHRQPVELPNVRTVQLEPEIRSAAEDRVCERGATEAKKKRVNRTRTWRVEEFHWSGRSHFKEGEKIIRVMKEAPGRVLVHPTGTVIHIRRFKGEGGGQHCFVYLETRADQRRRALAQVAKALGRGWKQRLLKTAIVRDPVDQEALLGYWER